MVQVKQDKKQRRIYLALITLTSAFFVLSLILDVVAVVVGIVYVAEGREDAGQIIVIVATVWAVVMAVVFTAVANPLLHWLIQVRGLEVKLEGVANEHRHLRPIRSAVDMRLSELRDSTTSSRNVPQLKRIPTGTVIQDESEATVVRPLDVPDSGNNQFYIVDHVGGAMFKPFHTNKLRTMSLPVTLMLLVSSLSVVIGSYALVWGITLAYLFGFGDENEIWPFITVEALAGLVCPVLMYIGFALFAVILDYITMGSLDARSSIHKLLPTVKLVRATTNEYWVIKDTFYYHIKKTPPDDVNSSCTSIWHFSRATFYFTIIIGLAFSLSTSFFMNATIVEQVNSRQCLTDLHYDCFVLEGSSWRYVDCADNETLSQHSFVHCYTFLRFGVDSSPLSNLSEAFAFYLAIVAFFSQVFGVVKVVLHVRPSRLWGIMFFVIGALVVMLAMFLVFYQGSVSVHRDVIGCFQVLMIGVFLLIVGMLLFEGGLWEREKIPPKQELLLYEPGHRMELDEYLAHHTEESKPIEINTAV